MCGIVGYIGAKDSKEILLNGLEKLEYRGYDSAGIYVLKKQKRVIYSKKKEEWLLYVRKLMIQ